MTWRPIEEYDAMDKKPKWVCFFIAPSTDLKNPLSARIHTERRFGFRNTTHFMILPEPPAEDNNV